MLRIACPKSGATGTMRMFFAVARRRRRLDRVGDDEALHRRIADPLHRRARQHAVGDVGVHLLGALAHQQLRRLHKRPRGVADVVRDHADPALDLADHRHRRHLARPGAALVDDRKIGADALGELARPGHPADVGRDHGDFLEVAEVVPDIEREDRRGIEVVHRQVEEPLDLRRMQIERQHPRHPRDGQEVRHQLGADRRARLRPPVLPGIAEIRHHRGDPVRRRPAQRVAHDQEFHQVVVRRVRRRLDDEHVLAADVLVDLDEDLGVVEPLHPGLDQLHRLAAVHRDPPRDRICQGPVRVACDQLGLEEGVHGRRSSRPLRRSSVIIATAACKAPPTTRRALLRPAVTA